MEESFVARWLEYSVTWVVRFRLAPARLVTAALSFSVAWTIFEKDYLIPTGLLDL